MDKADPKRRFLKFVPKGCWEWQGRRDSHGYGQFRLEGRIRKAHRVAYELFVGEIPKGMVLMHTCDNAACVRIDHLRPGTQEENMADRDQKGRTLKGVDVSSAKLTEKTAEEIRKRRSLGYERLAVIYGVGVDAVKRVLRGKTWKQDGPAEVS